MEIKAAARVTWSLAAISMIFLPSWALAQSEENDCVTNYDNNGAAHIFCLPAPKPPREGLSPRGNSSNTGGGTARPPVESLSGSTRSIGSAKTNGGTTTNPSGLIPARALIEPSDIPPNGVGAYGIVAFTAMPLLHEEERHRFVCEAFKATLIPQSDLPEDTPLSAQMITYWPVRSKLTELAKSLDCRDLVASYDLKTGLDAITDADKKSEKLATRRGPFLVAWSPAKTRSEKDAVVLVIELSNLESQESFIEVFKAWRQKIVDDPKLWRRGWNWKSVRLALRDTLDRYGDGIVRLIQNSKE
jgi:hypothetical protein